MMLRLLIATVLTSFALSSSVVAQRPLFTVRHSIEMTRFQNPDYLGTPQGSGAIFSPDQRYFVIQGIRGVVASDVAEATLWLFKTDEVKAYLRGPGRVPAPIRLATMSLPHVYNIIDMLQWAPDSKSVYFISADAQGDNRLYQANIVRPTVRPVTPAGSNMWAFVVRNNTIVYLASSHLSPPPTGKRINLGTLDVTGVRLSMLLFPQRYTGFYSELWTLRNGVPKKISGKDPQHPLEIVSLLFRARLFVDVKTDSAIVLLPLQKAEHSWNDYQFGYVNNKIDADDPNSVEPSNVERLNQYAIVDLSTGKVTPLVHAPAMSSRAEWSEDGEKILLAETYLPLDGISEHEREKRLYPCIAVVVDRASIRASCVKFDKFEAQRSQGKTGTQVTYSSFGSDGNEVILHAIEYPDRRRVNLLYKLEGAEWRLVSTEPANPQGLDPIKFEIREALNTPPAAWVTDPLSKSSKLLWDPNPQLAAFDFSNASIFKWKDLNGHEWTGGLVKPLNLVAGKRYPLVIQTHGFNPKYFLVDGPPFGATTAFAARALASAGIIVLQVQDSGTHMQQLEEPHDNAKGYKAAIEQLDAIGLIDPKRVGIVGWSRTNWYVKTALIHYRQLFAAASINDGIDNGYFQYLVTVNKESETIYGERPFGAGLATWVKEAPGFHMDQVKAPVLIAAIGPYSLLNEWEGYQALRLLGKPVSIRYFPNGQHNLIQPQERLGSQQGNVDWFRFWLQGYEDTDPAKAEQYEQWRRLRKLKEREQ